MPAVLFVCSGNTCRSPMAAALFKALLAHHGQDLSRWMVASAGTSATENQPAAPLAVQVTTHRGLDLRLHRSQRVTPRLLSRFNLILCMEESHLQAVISLVPDFASSVHLLSSMSNQTSAVEDPFGGSLEDYERTAQAIDHWLALGMENILKLAED